MLASWVPMDVSDPIPAALVLVAGFLVGAIPFSNLVAGRARGVDLREVETGTVSGTSLYKVAGFGPLALAGVLDVTKGAVGPLLAGGANHPALAAAASGAAVSGHNWSPFLRGAGGRGISPALGALLAWHWPGAVVIVLGLALGRLLGHTGSVSFVADLALVPALALIRGSVGAWAGVAVLVPMLAKRVLGNAPPADPGFRVYARRLVFDHDGGDGAGPGAAASAGP